MRFRNTEAVWNEWEIYELGPCTFSSNLALIIGPMPIWTVVARSVIAIRIAVVRSVVVTALARSRTDANDDSDDDDSNDDADR